ncbi:MAG: hypothetical protein KOO62_11860 [candidate division Zixibacteria bacterium]|nr:hypothetical protein [candidate division Zixibacteria bacterium]
MKRILSLTVSLLIVMVVVGHGLELSKTPIQTQMSQTIAGSGFGLKAVALNAFDSSNVEAKATLSGQKFGGQSKLRAGLYSLLVPGWGQYYNGRKTKARVFFAAEIVTWVSYFSLRTYGAWKKDDMIRHAEAKAGANLDGKDDDFFVWLEKYRDIDRYNDIGRLLETGSEYFPDDASHHWSWQSTEDRAVFRELRESSRTAYRRARWVMLVGLFDRVLAVVDAVRDARGGGLTDDGFFLSVAGKPVQLSVDPLAERNQVAITVYPGF